MNDERLEEDERRLRKIIFWFAFYIIVVFPIILVVTDSHTKIIVAKEMSKSECSINDE